MAPRSAPRPGYPLISPRRAPVRSPSRPTDLALAGAQRSICIPHHTPVPEVRRRRSGDSADLKRLGHGALPARGASCVFGCDSGCLSLEPPFELADELARPARPIRKFGANPTARASSASRSAALVRYSARPLARRGVARHGPAAEPQRGAPPNPSDDVRLGARCVRARF